MRQGRALEILVGQLEHVLGRGILAVQSPEFIPNRHTGDPVEVDVTLRGRVGSTEVLIAFECRDRGKAQGINWIRELATKRDDIGADSMTAVSRSGFTTDARAEAAVRRVHLRSLSHVSPKDVADSVLGIRLSVLRPRFRVTAVRKVGYRGFVSDFGQAPPSLTMQAFLGLAERPSERCLVDEKENRKISFEEMLLTADWKSEFDAVPVGSKRVVEVQLPCAYTNSYGRQGAERFRWFCGSDRGVVFTDLVVVAEVGYEPELVEMSSALQYSEEDRCIARVADFDLARCGRPQARLQVFMITETPLPPGGVPGGSGR